MDFKPRQLSKDEFKVLEKEFFTSIFGYEERQEEVFSQLDEFFSTVKIFKLEPYIENFWRLYVFLCWNMFSRQDANKMIQIVERQIPEALKMGFDVWEKLLWYFSSWTLQEETIKSLYTKVKGAFMSSTMPMSEFGENKFLVKDLVTEVVRLNERGNNSIELAEFRTKLSKLLSYDPEEYSMYIVDEKQNSAGNFIDLTHFFIGVDEDHIGPIIEAFTLQGNEDVFEVRKKLIQESEEKLKNIKKASVLKKVGIESLAENGGSQADAIEAESKPKSTVKKLKEEKSPEVEKQKIKKKEEPVVGKEKIIEKLKKPTPKKMTPSEIKKIIESRFSKDEDGVFTNIEGVLMFLGNLADEYNDSSISELYYYDEKSGEFKWNETLLK